MKRLAVTCISLGRNNNLQRKEASLFNFSCCASQGKVTNGVRIHFSDLFSNEFAAWSLNDSDLCVVLWFEKHSED
jgi:hypothetical protein